MAYRGSTYDFVIDSSFQPFSMQELLVPFTAYKSAYEQTEAAYDSLQTKANIWEGMASEQNDPETYNQYKKYADDLRAQAEDLAQNGLNMRNRRSLMDLKRRYSSEITPIEQAYAARKAQIDEQRKALLQNPTLLLSRRADLTSLDKYLKNPQLGYESYSGALLAQQVGQAASALAKSLTDYSKGKPLDGYTKTWLQQHGYSPAEVMQAITNPDSSNSSRVLNGIVDNVIASSSLSQWADDSTIKQARGIASMGLWNAVGNTQMGTYTDEAAKLAAQTRANKELAKYQAGLTTGSPTGFDPEFDTRNVRTPRDIEDDAYNKQMLEKYKDYFEQSPTGLWKLTEEGQKEFNRSSTKIVRIGHGIMEAEDPSFKSELRKWMESRGLSEMGKGHYGSHQSSIVQGMMDMKDNLLDTHAAMEYIRGIGSENYDDVVSSLTRASKEGMLTNYGRIKDSNGNYSYAPMDEVDIRELTPSDIKSAQVVYGDQGDFLEVNLKGGSVVLQPFVNLSPTYTKIVSGNRNMVDRYREAKAQGYETIDDQFGRPIPIDDWINAELNSYGKNLASALSRTKVKTREVEPGYYGTR